MKFCQFIENTNGTNFPHNLATFGQYEVFRRSAKHGNPMGDLYPQQHLVRRTCAGAILPADFVEMKTVPTE